MLARLRADLIADEGRLHSIYICPAGHPTFGVGHMIKADDPEASQPVGSAVTVERVDEAFNQDIESCLKDCRHLFKGFDDLPEEVRIICCNMMFNLGLPRLAKFVKFRKCVEEKDWPGAAEEMRDSRWHRQLPRRSGRLINRMEKIT